MSEAWKPYGVKGFGVRGSVISVADRDRRTRETERPASCEEVMYILGKAGWAMPEAHKPLGPAK